MVSSDTQVRAQLTSSADAIMKQAGQLSRTRLRWASREVVPDIYRKAMVGGFAVYPYQRRANKIKVTPFLRHTGTLAPTASQSVAVVVQGIAGWCSGSLAGSRG